MNLTRELLQSCVPPRFCVTPPRITKGTNGDTVKFSVSIPLGEIGFVVTQYSGGTIWIQDRYNVDDCKHQRRVGKKIGEKTLKTEIEREIRRQTMEGR